MRMVTSPTGSQASRRPWTRLAAALALTLGVLAVSGPSSSPALAIDSSSKGPYAAGSFRGYAFDACSAPSQSVMDAWNLKSPFSAIGIYVSGSSRYCGDAYQKNLTASWVKLNAAHGWRFLPIHVGYQSPCFKNNPTSRVQKKHMSSSTTTARTQGTSDATEAIAALKKYGFPAKSVMYLDLEYYARTTTCDNAVLAFTDAWTEKLHAAGYLSGVYSSGSAAIAAIDKARADKKAGYTLPDVLWNAWTNGKANTDGGPYLADTGWADHQRVHQYQNGVDVTYGGHKVNIDRDFVDVGKGTVATKESKPCGVTMTFAKYSALKKGSTGAQVSALQCALKQAKLYSAAVNGIYGNATVAAVNAFRKSIHWAQNGTTTSVIWTGALSAGTVPRVLKYGSVGEPVWRLQRSLRASGLTVGMTGKYDLATVKAVEKYRTKHGSTAYTTTDASVWSLLQQGRLG